MTDNAKTAKSGRGGKRIGAGRKKKNHHSPSSLSAIDIKALLEEPAPTDITSSAQQHSHMAIEALSKQMLYGASEAAKISAAKEILDRGYFKPSTDTGGMQLTLFGAGVSATEATEIRDHARKFANLAVAVLWKITTCGESESARVSAAKALIERHIGTAPIARVVDGGLPRSMGKKEEAQQVARNLAAGRFATREPPRSAYKTLQ